MDYTKSNLYENARFKIPIFVKGIFNKKHQLSEGQVSDTLGSVTKEIGARVLAYLHQANQAAAQKNISDANKIRSDVLLHHYAAQLGVRTSHIRTVLNDYERIKPVAPSPLLLDKTGKPILIPGKKGKNPVTAINTNYPIEKREYDSKLKEFEERERLKKQIRGLHKSIPLLGQLAKSAGDYTERAKDSLRGSNPVVTRSVLGSGTSRNTRVADVLTQYADVLRKRRAVQSKIRKIK